MVDCIRSRLLNGLTARDVTYFYQPLYQIQSGEVDRAEVLLRVRDGAGGFFDTESVIAAAEELALIDEMDRQAFIHACEVLPAFRACGVTELSVNLSPAACHSPRLLSEVRRIMTETGTDPENICLEITEADSSMNEAFLFDRLRALCDMGVKIALDDFGKGCSNLQRMIHMPFHILKIDKSLVWGLDQRGMAASLLSNIIQTMREYGITTVAEGVETAEQVATLTQMGCDYLQGFYFSPPVPMEAFLEVVMSRDYQK